MYICPTDESRMTTVPKPRLGDYRELSIWQKNQQMFPERAFKCKWWMWDVKKGSGTMSGLQRHIKDSPVLLVIVGFLRGCGMFYGLSNPLMGVFSLIAALVNSPFNFLYLIWTVGWSMVWAFTIDAPKELIYNGLYPSQGILLGYAVFINFDPFILSDLPNGTVIAIGLVALVPLTFFVIILFQCLANVMTKHLGVSPMFMSSMVIGQLWWLMTGYSHHFINYNIYPQMLEPPREPCFFNVTFEEYYTEVIYGVSMLQFSNSFYCFIPITIGLFLTSPIACVTSWCGSFIGISSTVLLGIEFKYVRLGLFGLNGAIAFSSIAGSFFVLNASSLVLATLCTFFTSFLCIALKAFCTPYGIPYFGIPSTIVVMIVYTALDNVPGLYRVPVIALTVPEDHLKRAKANKLLGAQIPFYTKIVVGRNLSYELRKAVDAVFTRALLEKCVLNKENTIAKKLLKTKVKAREGGISTIKALIHTAVQAGNFEIFKILYNSKSYILAEQVLETAILFQQDEIMNHMLDDGVGLLQDNPRVAQNINQAIYENKIESVARWVRCGACLSSEDYAGCSPLVFARLTNNAAALKLLESQNKCCRDYSGDYNGHAGLAEEAKYTEWDIEQYFEKKAVKTSNKCLANETADAVKHVVVEILRRNNEITSKDDEALLFVLICYLMKHQSTHFQEVVEDEGLSLALKDQFQNSLLHKCSEFNLVDVIKYLISRGVNTETKNRFGCRPLEITLDDNDSSIHTFREIMAHTSASQISYLTELRKDQFVK